MYRLSIGLAAAAVALTGCHVSQGEAQQKTAEHHQAEARAYEAEAARLEAEGKAGRANTAAASGQRPIVSSSTTTTGNTAPAAGGGLKIGEYACYGGSTGSGPNQLAGGRSTLLIGLGFKVLSGNSYVDLDAKNPGSFTVSGSSVTFRGGIHDGEVGRDVAKGRFVLGSKVVCEPW
jgi:hypothetical protein